MFCHNKELFVKFLLTMSQSIPLASVLNNYEEHSNNLRRKVQQDRILHMSILANAYMEAASSGASDNFLTMMEEMITNRDKYNCRKDMLDASEWKAMDKRTQSLMGVNVGVLSGGPSALADPNAERGLIHAARVFNAYMWNMTRKLHHDRHVHIKELLNLLKEAKGYTSKEFTGMLGDIFLDIIKYNGRKDALDASQWQQMEKLVRDYLAPHTAVCILRCGADGKADITGGPDGATGGPVGATGGPVGATGGPVGATGGPVKGDLVVIPSTHPSSGSEFDSYSSVPGGPVIEDLVDIPSPHTSLGSYFSAESDSSVPSDSRVPSESNSYSGSNSDSDSGSDSSGQSDSSAESDSRVPSESNSYSGSNSGSDSGSDSSGQSDSSAESVSSGQSFSSGQSDSESGSDGESDDESDYEYAFDNEDSFKGGEIKFQSEAAADLWNMMQETLR
jgi:hypothetical protein